METLFEFNKIAYNTIKYKDYCEISEDELSGRHKTDNDFKGFSFLDVNKNRFDYVSSHNELETYQENLNNLCCQNTLNRMLVTVKKNDVKVSIKFYNYQLLREVGKPYFRKFTACQFLTYNFKDNSFYNGIVIDYHKKRKFKKKLYKNNWCDKIIKTFSEKISAHLKGFKSKNFEDLQNCQMEINKAFDVFFSSIPGIDLSISNPDDRLYKKYLDGQGIKVPNNWISFERGYPQIKLKDFRKNKMKFVDTYMDFHELKGDKIKRVLHTVTTTKGILTLEFALKFFGYDFILSQDDEIIKKIIESNPIGDITSITISYKSIIDGYNKKEIKNCFEIFKLTLTGEINIWSFCDHIRYKSRLKNLEPVQWNSNTYEKFTEEHYEWAEKIGSYQTAQYTRFYNKDFKQIVEKPIYNYYPVLLVDSKQYNVESFVQSNCVRTYADKPASIIVSIRQNDNENKERASVEYKITGDENSVILKRVQSLGRFNKSLDETWDDILRILDERMDYCLDNNIFELPTFEVKVGNKILKSDLIFSDQKEYDMYPGQRGIKNITKNLYFSNREVYSLGELKFNLNLVQRNENPF